MLRGNVRQILQYQERNGGVELRFATRGEDQSDLGVAGDPPCEVRGCGIVHGHGDGGDEQAAPEGSNPFGGVRTPDQDAVTGSKTTRFESVRKEQSIRCEAVIRPANVTTALLVNDRAIAREAFEFGKQGDE